MTSTRIHPAARARTGDSFPRPSPMDADSPRPAHADLADRTAPRVVLAAGSRRRSHGEPDPGRVDRKDERLAAWRAHGRARGVSPCPPTEARPGVRLPPPAVGEGPPGTRPGAGRIPQGRATVGALHL